MTSRPVCAVLSTAYFPPVEYFMAAAMTGSILIEAQESYVKQSYRNRCRIYACDGVLSLTVPVSMPENSRGISMAVVDYSKPWLQQHERAIVSAYRTSAFFEYYQDDIFPILESRPAGLLDLNMALTLRLLDLLGIRCSVSLTEEYRQSYGPEFLDLRDALHPKKTVPEIFRDRLRPYYQVFSAKFGFIPGLSAVDLLFNEGPDALSYLALS
jgi:hypothetical protein